MVPTIQFTVKIGCPNACRCCPQDKLVQAYPDQASKYMSYDDFCLILNKIPKNVRIHFSGFGEPFTNPETSKMIKTTYDNGYAVALYSTLIGVTPEDITMIEDVQFAIFTVHVPDRNNFKYPTDIWLGYFDMIKSAGFAPNLVSLGEIDEKLTEHLPYVYQLGILSRGGANDQVLSERRIGGLTCIETGRDFNQNVVLPNGDVYLCCMDFGLKHKLGNLFSDKYEDLFKSEEFYRVSNAIRSENEEIICRYCEWAKNRC
jgi:radical SAM protein with 4Fe4S-binding SPASM domain